MDYLGKGEMRTNRDVKNNVCTKSETNLLFVLMQKFWDQHFTFCVYILFSVISCNSTHFAMEGRGQLAVLKLISCNSTYFAICKKWGVGGGIDLSTFMRQLPIPEVD
jgi:hypothetical protein